MCAEVPMLLVSAALAETYTLTAALEAARLHAPDAQAIEGRRAVARGDAGVARAPLLPQVSVSGGYRRNDKEIAFPNPFDPTTTLTVQDLDVASVTVSASQVVFSGQAFGRAGAAGQLDQAAEAAQLAARLDLDLRVASAWLQARGAVELAQAAKEALDSAEAHRRAAEGALAAGTLTALGLDRAKLAELEARQRLLEAERAREDALGVLGTYVGGEARVEPQLWAEAAEASEGASVEDALARRPELLVARAQLAAARAGTWTVVGDWAPTVSAVGAYTVTTSPFFSYDPSSWYAGVSASLPVLDGGLRFAEARRTNGQIQAAEAAVARLEASTVEEVRAALRGEHAAETALELARAQEDVARHALEIAEASFGAGGATAVDVDDATAAVLAARAGRVRAEAAWLTARWQRLRLCGRGIEG